MTETQFAYLAGLIDGEGTVGAWRNSRGYYQPQVSITMTHEPTILWLQATFGGNVHMEKGQTDKHKAKWKWQCMSSPIREFLPKALPYMITKHRQAELVLQLLGMRQRGANVGSGLNNVEAQAAICSELKEINRRGVAV